MNKALRLVSVFFLFTNMAFAQSFSVEKKSVTIVRSEHDQDMFYDKINIINNTNNNINMRWVRTQVSIPAAWETSVCDSTICYPNDKDSAVFLLPANGINYINIHFYPNHVKGSGFVKILVYKTGNPSEREELTFLAATDSASASGIKNSNHTQSSSKIILYPNPANNLLHIETENHNLSSSAFEIYDANGRKMTLPTLAVNGNSAKLNISDFSKGIYFIRISNAGNNIFSRSFIKE